jgi:hypothetical protein
MSEDSPLKPIFDRIPSQWGCSADIDEGWYQLVLDLNEALAKIEPDYEIYQVKEKFGGLRYYTSVTDDLAHKLIKVAEAASYRICERCGKPGRERNDKWIRVLCDEHVQFARKPSILEPITPKSIGPGSGTIT